MQNGNLPELKRSPLERIHGALDGRMIEFGGWEMPGWYSGIEEEHMAVRKGVGIFDLSHMGEIIIEGPDALRSVQRLVTNDAAKLANGQLQYATMCREDGGIIDDLTIYKIHARRFMLVVNAANIEKDCSWIKMQLVGNASVADASDQVSLMALQGPRAQELMSHLVRQELSGISYYYFFETMIGYAPVLISRSGYTGEDGFEIYCDKVDAENLWQRIYAVGQSFGLIPCGLAARDTLRLEAGMMLYGNDIDESHTPLEAGLAWTVKLRKNPRFVGQNALLHQSLEGVKTKLVGFTMATKRIPRHGYEILNTQRGVVGSVTSGAWSPTLQKSIGLGYVLKPYAPIGTRLIINARGKPEEARVVKVPFYKRSKKGDNQDGNN